MNLFFKLSLALFLLPFSLFAQSNYKTGYVVTLKGDTLSGFINYKEWDNNPSSISFKKRLDDNKIDRYTVDDISCFSLPGKASYQKFTCPISTGETNLSRVGGLKDTSYKIATVFLKVLQKGKRIALYQYTDDIKSRFYVAEGANAGPVELIYRVYNDNNGTDGKLTEEPVYKKQLYALGIKYDVKDDNFAGITEASAYDEVDLLQVVSAINGVSKAEFQKNYIRKNKITFYVAAMLNSSKTSPDPLSVFTEQGGLPSTSASPAIALGVNLFGDPNTGRMQVRVEFGVTSAKYNTLYISASYPHDPYRGSFDNLIISIMPHLIYNFYNSENFKIYGGGGIALTYYSYSNSFYGAQSAKESEFNKRQFGFNNVLFPLALKAGIQLHKNWELFVNYLESTSVTTDGFFAFNQDKKQIGINYFFK